MTPAGSGGGRTAAGQPYVVLDFVPGGTLADRVVRDGPLPWPDVAEIGVKLAGALASAHAAGVLHRDIKPENVLLSASGEPLLTDFGMAWIRGATGTPTGALAASAAHASPELLSGQPAVEPSDVYSLASTLYALVAGRSPFARSTDESLQSLLHRAMSEAPPDLRPLGLPGPLWEALAAALAKDPSARTSSANAFGASLRSAQRAAGLNPTPLLTPDGPTEAGPVVAGGAAGGAGAPGPAAAAPAAVLTAPARPSAPPPASASPAGTGRLPWVIALVVGVLLVLATATCAVTRGSGDGTRASAPTTPVVPDASTTVPGEEPTPTAGGGATSTAPRQVSPPASTAPGGPTGTAAPTTTPATTPATTGEVPACSPSILRLTLTKNQDSYRNGDPAVVTATFENVSGRACSYGGTTVRSQVLNPSGQPLGPAQTLSDENADGVPFEPGTTRTFTSRWNVSVCSAGSTCFPGRYTMVVDVDPFGGGRIPLDVV